MRHALDRMPVRRAILLATLVALPAGLGRAQVAPLDLRVHRGQLRDAGTFHTATRTWTRAGRTPGIPIPDNSQTVYQNTCFWTGLAANTFTFNGIEPCHDVYDEGRIPAVGPVGALTDNDVTHARFAHVTFAAPGSVDVELTFYDTLGGMCVGGASPTPPEPPFAGKVRLNTANGVTLPGDPTGAGTAWIVDVDLRFGDNFCLRSDGDGTTGNGNDLFTWRFRHYNSIPPFAMNQGGPIIAGELFKGVFGTCTYDMMGAQACGTDPGGIGPCGTGLGANDSFWENLDGDVADGSANNSSATCPQTFGTACFFFGGWPGNPWSSYFLTIRAGDCNAFISPYYCVGKTTSTGCIPFLTRTGTASVTSTEAFVIRTNDNIANEAGLLFYGFKRANLNFHGGKLCVKAPFVRTGAKSAKPTACVNPGGACTTATCGFLTRNFNTNIQNGSDPLLTVGQTVNAQWRQRDPTNPFGDNLSDGVCFLIHP